MKIDEHTRQTDYNHFLAEAHLPNRNKFPEDIEALRFEEQKSANEKTALKSGADFRKARDIHLSMLADSIYDTLTDGQRLSFYDYEEVMCRVDCLVRAGAILEYQGGKE